MRMPVMQLTAVFLEKSPGYEALVEELPGTRISAATKEEARQKLAAAVLETITLQRELLESSLSMAHVPYWREPLQVD